MVPEAGSGLGLLLILIAFVAGVGATAIGPGGIFLTIALFSLAALPPAEVAGTASALMVAAGIFGSLFYFRSGELKRRASRDIAVVLSFAGMLGGLAGSWLNSFVSAAQFGVALGTVAIGTGSVIVYQEWRGLAPHFGLDGKTWRSLAVLGMLGFGIGSVSGLVGVGGPVLAVPALVVLGMPMLTAIALAQAQSVFIAVFATAGYMARGTVAWPLVALVGAPLLAGVFLGWKIARRIDPRRLKVLLGVVLIAVGPYLAAGIYNG